MKLALISSSAFALKSSIGIVVRDRFASREASRRAVEVQRDRLLMSLSTSLFPNYS